MGANRCFAQWLQLFGAALGLQLAVVWCRLGLGCCAVHFSVYVAGIASNTETSENGRIFRGRSRNSYAQLFEP